MQTWCERQGQVEIGAIEHEGHTFAALGASVQGRHVTGYTGLQRRDSFLSTWCGRTMLACRSEVVEEYHDGPVVLMFRLTKGRYIVGYALGEKGMLFRGELVTDCTTMKPAAPLARSPTTSPNWMPSTSTWPASKRTSRLDNGHPL